MFQNATQGLCEETKVKPGLFHDAETKGPRRQFEITSVHREEYKTCHNKTAVHSHREAYVNIIKSN